MEKKYLLERTYSQQHYDVNKNIVFFIFKDSFFYLGSKNAFLLNMMVCLVITLFDLTTRSLLLR